MGPDCFSAQAEISTRAASGNIEKIREITGRNIKIFAVVKADAYAHGAAEMARAFISGGADCLCVAGVREAVELRNAGIVSPILVLNPPLDAELPAIAEHRLTPMADRASTAKKLGAISSKIKRDSKIHVEIDTGMGRSGILPSRAVKEIKEIAGVPGIEIDGIFTHLSSAEEDDTCFSVQQIIKFRQLLSDFKAAGISAGHIHAANSAGIIRFPESIFNAVRPGLLLYGISPLPGRAAPTERVLELKTVITRIRKMPPDAHLSYGRTYTTSGKSLIATLPAGYADGYDRRLSNRAFAVIGGRRARLVGRICMDRCLADVTGMGAKEGDEAVLIGAQGKETVTVEELSQKAGTIPQEFISRLGKRIRRVYI